MRSSSVECHTVFFKQHSIVIAIILFVSLPVNITFSIPVEFLLHYYFLCNLNHLSIKYFVKYFEEILVTDFEFYLMELQNCNPKLFLCPPQK